MGGIYGLSDMLKEVGGGDVEISKKEKVEKVSPAERTENRESIVDTKAKETKKSKKVNTKKSGAKKGDRDYTSTMIRKDTLNLIKLMFPDDFIQDSVDSILTEWIDRNEKNIEQVFKRSLKRKNLRKKN